MALVRLPALDIARATLRVARARAKVPSTARAVCIARSAASQAMSLVSNLSNMDEARREATTSARWVATWSAGGRERQDLRVAEELRQVAGHDGEV